MARMYQCDGCGDSVEKPRHHGYFRKVDYCDSCSRDYLAFMEARDRFHTEIAEKWKHGVAGLEAGFFDLHPNGKLPDR